MSNSTRKCISALLVIDMQYDFVHGSLAVPDATSVIDEINSLLALPFTIKIATKDFHPADHVSFAVVHDKPPFSKIIVYPPGETENRPLEQVLWPVHCVASTPGSEFVQGLHLEAFDAVVHKGIHREIETYSGFRDPWHLTTTELPSLLEAQEVTDVVVVGVAGDYCVKYTALDAVDFGYSTWVVRDAIRDVFNTETHWEEMRERGIHIVKNMTEVQSMLRG
ncbi:Isochorismatase hydrolase [Tricholoma matsutake]|nr:Isochorismatase hydrolase [Tricholoma matsutake 945]